MTPAPPPPDPLVIDWLLSALCRRLYLSAEMGLLACIECPPEQYRAFVDAHVARPARALAEVLRLAAAEAGLGAAAKPLDGVALWAEMLAATMLTLGEFRSLPVNELRDATDRFSGAWLALRGCIAEAASVVGVDLSCLRDQSSPHDRRAAETLNVLYSELERSRNVAVGG